MDDPYKGWDGSFFAATGTRPAPDFLGLTRPEAEQMAATRGISEVRVADLDLDPAATLLMDYRSGRLTLLVHGGKVVRAAFF